MGGWAGQGDLGKTTAQPSTPVSIPSVEVPTGSSTPVNNSNFVPPTVESLKQQELNKITTESLSNALSPTTKLKSSAFVFKNILAFANALKNMSNGEVLTIDDSIKALAENAQLTMQQQDELSDYLTRQQDALSAPSSGVTLPSVLTNNTKSLVTSIGTLTSTFGEKFDYFNNYMYGLLQYMDIATGLMDKTYTLSKDLADQAKKEKEKSVEVGDTKMTADEIKVAKDLAMMHNYQYKTRSVDNSVLEATNLSGMTPLQIEVSKNSYIAEASEFSKKPVEQIILEADSVVGMSPREIEVSHRSNEVEAKVYSRTPTTVKDIDENVLFDIAPREARLVKDSVTAINSTDEKNFELDDDDADIVSPFDVSSIFGYERSSDIIEQFIKKMQGITSA